MDNGTADGASCTSNGSAQAAYRAAQCTAAAPAVAFAKGHTSVKESRSQQNGYGFEHFVFWFSSIVFHLHI